MSDSFKANGELAFDVTRFVRDINRAVDVLTELEHAPEGVQKQLQGLEKTLVDVAQQAKASAGVISKSEKAQRQSQADTIRLKKAYTDDEKRDQAETARLREMYAQDERRSQTETLRLKAMYAKEEQALAARTAKVEADQARKAAAAEKQAATAAARTDNERYNNLSRTRYALYDVSTAYTAVGVAALGAATAVQAVGIAYERDFASVARTSGLQAKEDIDALKASLIDLSTDLPSSFTTITDIATLAGQLGVAAQDIEDFTRVVTMFEASTDVTADKAAESIGRVAQLTGTSADEYENLASAIYQTGVTAVATESAILETATNIATAGDLANFTNHQIIALASAFASLGVAPERARGSVQRIFAEMTEAAGQGGQQLRDFAAISNMSATEFAATWKNEPQQAFTAFVEGLGRMQDAGEDTNATIKDLGIWAVRDIQALQVLANNADVYSTALRETSSAYAEGTALQEGYQFTATTLAAKLAVLGNTIKAMMDAASNNGPLGVLVDVLQFLAESLLKVAQTPVVSTLLGIAVALAAGIGLWAAYQAVTARVTASIYAFTLSMRDMQKTQGQIDLGLKGMISSLYNFSVMMGNSSGATARFVTNLRAVPGTVAMASGAVDKMKTAVWATGAAFDRGGAAAGRFAGVAKSALAMTGWGIGILAVTKGVELLGDALKSSGDRAKEFFGGDLSSLSQALAADTQAWRAHTEEVRTSAKHVVDTTGVFGTFQAEVENSSTTADKAVSSFDRFTGTQSDLGSAVQSTSTEVDSQTVAVGKNTKEWALNALTTGEAGEKLFEFYKNNQGLIQDAGINFEEILTAALNPESGGADAVIQGYIDRIEAELAQINASSAAYAAGTKENAIAAARIGNLNGQVESLKDLRDIMGNTTDAVSEAGLSMKFTAVAADALGIDVTAAGDAADGAGDSMESTGNKAKEMADALFASVQGAADIEGALYKLGGSLYENGNSFSEFSESGRANLDALAGTVNAMAAQAGDDTAAFTSNVIGLVADLQNQGVNTQTELGFVFDALQAVSRDEWGVKLDMTAARQDIRNFISDAIAALETRAALERSAQTAVVAGPFRDPSKVTVPKVLVNPELDNINAQIEALRNLGNSLSKTESTGRRNNKSLADGYRDTGRAADEAAKKQAKNKKATEDAAKAVRTFVDYANDLRSVTDRAFDIRFGDQQAKDDFRETIVGARDAAKAQDDAVKDSRDKIVDIRREITGYTDDIKGLKAEILGIKASNKLLDYQLAIAKKYGDAIAVDRIGAEIAKNNAELSEKQTELTETTEDQTQAEKDLADEKKNLKKALRDADAGLSGNSQAARDNRDAMLAVIKASNNQITEMAANGASQKTLKAQVDKNKDAFYRLGKELGYTKDDLGPLAKGFDDTATAISKVPKNVTVKMSADKSGVNAGLSAYREFKNKNIQINMRTTGKVDDSGLKAWEKRNTGGKGISRPINKPIKTTVNDSGLKKAGRGIQYTSDMYRLLALQQKALDSGDVKRAQAYQNQLNAKGKRLRAGTYMDGGYTGRGPKDEEAGVVHRGEYVVPQQYVNQSTGLPDLNALGQSLRMQSLPAKASASASAPSVNPIQLVEILPNQLRALQDAMSVLVTLEGRQLAAAVNQINTQNNVRGTR